MNIKRIITIGALTLTIAAMTATASAQTFGKGTKIWDKNGKCMGALPCKMNLTVLGEEKSPFNGKMHYKVKGKGKYSGSVGYIKKSDALSNNAGLTYKEEDGLHGWYISCDCANVRDANGDIIGKLKGGTKIEFVKYSKSPTMNGDFIKFKYKGGYGYVYAGLVTRG